MMIAVPAAAQTQSAREQVQAKLGPTGAIDTTTAAHLSATFRAASQRALPGVVFIAVQQNAPQRPVAQGPRQNPARPDSQGSQPRQLPPGMDLPDFLDQYRDFLGLPEGADPVPVPRGGTGSGFIIDADGHIMTNNHVVANASRVTVRLLDGRVFNARVIGRDSATDVAVIKIEPTGAPLPVVTLGTSEDVRVGDWILALGTPFGTLDFTVTAGIVSAKGRTLQTNNPAALQSFIQTDAAINPGNSGGPLVDLYGRVVGINSAISGATGTWVGYGFAVPIDLAKRVADDLMKYGYTRRPRLGASVQAVDAVDAEVYGLREIRGAEIIFIQENTPAAEAGIHPGDVVLALNDRPLQDNTDFIARLAQQQPGDRVKLSIWRDRKPVDLTVRLGEFEHTTAPAPVPPAKASTPAERLGFSVEALTPENARQVGYTGSSGVVVSTLDRGGSAWGSGLLPINGCAPAGACGHVLLSINGQVINTPEDVARIAATLAPGSAVGLRVFSRTNGLQVVNYRFGQ
jgi:serine protease Do